MNLDYDLSILARFLSRLAPEIEGRDAGDPPPELASRLDAFAAGQSNAAERAALAQQLKDEPQWLRYLARAIRAQAA